MAVRISAPARLHLGLIDLRGDLGRMFGSLGVGLARPRFVVTGREAAGLHVEGGGDAARRVEQVAAAFLRRYAPGRGAHLEVEETIPAHAGLGSGTQLTLATGTALAHLLGVDVAPDELAGVLDRGRRSGIGTAIFDQGGFVVDGGRIPGAARGEERTPPVIARHPVPAAWRFVLVIPGEERGLSGAREEQAFAALPPPAAETVGRICRLLVMRVLPALVEGEIGPCGAGLTEIQALVGDSFAAAQGGRFATALGAAVVQEMLQAGAAGAGQSSWGPAVFALVASEESAAALSRRLQAMLGRRHATVVTSAADNHGAVVTMF